MSVTGKTLIFSLNPAVDVEWIVPKVLWEEKNNILSERRWAGGKGVNVARWFRLLSGDTGETSQLVIPLGGLTGREMEEYLTRDGIAFRAFPLKDSTRANIIVTTDDKRQLRFNPLGPELTSEEWDSLFRFARETQDVKLAIFSGALPRNAPKDTYRKLLEIFSSRSIKTILDCDGEAFAQGVDGHPFLVKPNEFELAQWAGYELPDIASIQSAAKDLSSATQGNVLVSLGADGALMVGSQGEYRVYSPQVKVLNKIGAGDSLLSGISYAVTRQMPPVEALQLAIATSTSAVACAAGLLPSREDIFRLKESVRVERLN